jgi:hypothetical protein
LLAKGFVPAIPSWCVICNSFVAKYWHVWRFNSRVGTNLFAAIHGGTGLQYDMALQDSLFVVPFMKKWLGIV